jgi:hypothetical protein
MFSDVADNWIARLRFARLPGIHRVLAPALVAGEKAVAVAVAVAGVGVARQGFVSLGRYGQRILVAPSRVTLQLLPVIRYR